MYSNSALSLNEQKVYIYADTGCAFSTTGVQIMSERNLFTHQIGHLLITLGAIFVNVPSFSRHIDRNTGELLISLGNKLKARK